MIKQSLKKIILLFVTTSLISLVLGISIAKHNQANKDVLGASVSQDLPAMNITELSKYDGTNPDLPIYLALDGEIYDITPGKEFYQVGGPYHDLAGKDSSTELHFIGGNIIRRKYKVVARLVP